MVNDMNKRNGRWKMIAGFLLVFLLIAGFLIYNDNKIRVVGKEIQVQQIQEFFATYATSTSSPLYQRVVFSVCNQKYRFDYERKEGNHLPLTNHDVVCSGRIELTEEQWSRFIEHLKGGSVSKRKESIESGSSGPWFYLYYENDRGKFQSFTFSSYSVQKSFEDFCRELVSSHS